MIAVIGVAVKMIKGEFAVKMIKGEYRRHGGTTLGSEAVQ